MDKIFEKEIEKFKIQQYLIYFNNVTNFYKKILIISDFHNCKDLNIYNVLQDIEFESTFFVGDLCSGHIVDKFNEPSRNFINYLSKISTVYYSLGNHEWQFNDEDKKYLIDHGIKLLDNSYVSINNVYIGGLSSPLKYEKNGILPEYCLPNIRFLDDFDLLNGFKILLCHHPEYYDNYLKNRSFNLIVSGHAHGGQMRIFDKGLYAPGQGFFPKYVSGIYYDRLIVSSGLANTIPFIPRMNNKFDIIVLNTN